MRTLPLQHFFTVAVLAPVGCAGASADAAPPVVDVSRAPASGSEAARPRAPEPPFCLPRALHEGGRLDVVEVAEDGAVTFCLTEREHGRLCVTARQGSFSRAEVAPPPAILPRAAELERLRDVGRRRAWLRCVTDELCAIVLDDDGGARAPVERREVYARTPSLVIDALGDRVALLDAAGTLRFLSAESLQLDGEVHVRGATLGAVVAGGRGLAFVVGGAPRAGTVTGVDLTTAVVRDGWSPPVCR